jgi:metal-dependent amidase/aminoacylase/carboxypeptidase family protein
LPKYAAAEFSVRAATSDTSFAVVEKVIRCAQAGALAAGAELKHCHLTHYANRLANPTLARLFAANIGMLGERVEEPAADERMGSSDMGNISHLIPAIHPYVTIADPGISGHTPEFAVAAASERGNQAMLRAAKALAMTAVDLLTQHELMEQAQSEFRQMVNPGAAWRKLRFFS